MTNEELNKVLNEVISTRLSTFSIIRNHINIHNVRYTSDTVELTIFNKCFFEKTSWRIIDNIVRMLLNVRDWLINMRYEDLVKLKENNYLSAYSKWYSALPMKNPELTFFLRILM